MDILSSIDFTNLKLLLRPLQAISEFVDVLANLEAFALDEKTLIYVPDFLLGFFTFSIGVTVITFLIRGKV